MANFCLFAVNRNRKQKFIFLGWQTKTVIDDCFFSENMPINVNVEIRIMLLLRLTLLTWPRNFVKELEMTDRQVACCLILARLSRRIGGFLQIVYI
jgi:hypothetical protein